MFYLHFDDSQMELLRMVFANKTTLLFSSLTIDVCIQEDDLEDAVDVLEDAFLNNLQDGEPTNKGIQFERLADVFNHLHICVESETQFLNEDPHNHLRAKQLFVMLHGVMANGSDKEQEFYSLQRVPAPVELMWKIDLQGTSICGAWVSRHLDSSENGTDAE